MVPFAGYAMPVQYGPGPRCRGGVLAEHLHCRAAAALFDVSHMGQALLTGPGAAAALERLVPGDIAGLAPGRQRYTMLTNESGGILDDLMVANAGDFLFLVANASRKDADFAHIETALPAGVTLTRWPDRALLALQGPEAAAVMARLCPGAAALPFLGFGAFPLAGIPCLISRSGYTGEDGFEISAPADRAVALADALLAEPPVALAGLGARDSLRLEAGLCLYGSDIDTDTTPIEAGLAWTIGKRRRAAWDFPGGTILRDQLAAGPARRRVGLRLDGRAPARAGADILDPSGTVVGSVTSGLFSPTLQAPIALGYVPAALAAIGTRLAVSVRGAALPAAVVRLPFVPHRYV
ncbi:MAG: glycine cleavage system aminomethyltransferase GcvT [Rhodospirillales bacterium]|nr:glycine cleavage system aminomethyltransferase GcvT [Rhodospirillales bacterium]